MTQESNIQSSVRAVQNGQYGQSQAETPIAEPLHPQIELNFPKEKPINQLITEFISAKNYAPDPYNPVCNRIETAPPRFSKDGRILQQAKPKPLSNPLINPLIQWAHTYETSDIIYGAANELMFYYILRSLNPHLVVYPTPYYMDFTSDKDTFQSTDFFVGVESDKIFKPTLAIAVAMRRNNRDLPKPPFHEKLGIPITKIITIKIFGTQLPMFLSVLASHQNPREYIQLLAEQYREKFREIFPLLIP